MNKALEAKTQEWMQLERMTLEQRKKAAEFYDRELLHLVADDYINRNQKRVKRKIQHFVVSVGIAHEPIVLNLKLLKPEKIFFMYTEKSERILNQVVQFCELSPDVYEKRRVDEVDPLDIYRTLLDMYLEWGQPKDLVIDFTGGTKTMSASAALAGSIMNAQMVYVASDDYLPDFRKPRPGSERLVYIDDPLGVFGELEFAKSIELFQRKNYAGAAAKLVNLKDRVPDPNLRQQMNFVYLLAKSYEAYDALDFEAALPYMVRLNMELQRDKRVHGTFILMDYTEDLLLQEEQYSELARIPELMRDGKQLQILKTPKLIYPLMFTMYQNADNRKFQEKYDMATLLYYRLLEMIEQRRLARYNLNAARMDYLAITEQSIRNPSVASLRPDERVLEMKRKIYEIRQQLFKKNITDNLPVQAALLEGFMILYILGDGIMEAGHNGSGGIDLLKQIRNMVTLRNHSIFAHGLGPVGKEKYLKFEEFVKGMFRKFCGLEKIQFEKMAEIFKEREPGNSIYYTFGKK